MEPIENIELQISISVKRYRTDAGDPTCAKSFPQGHVCDFLIADPFALGSIGYCAMLGGMEGPVIRRERGTNDLRYLLPHKDCPLWSNAQ